MTKPNRTIELSRRKLLGGLGTVGAASAAAGLGTTAYLSDTEAFENNTLVAGQMDTRLDWQQIYDGRNGREYVNAYPDRYKNDPKDKDKLLTDSSPEKGADGIQDPIKSRDDVAKSEYGKSYSDLDTTEKQTVETKYREQFANSPNLVVGGPIIEVEDAKPGDRGAVNYSIHLFDEPGYVWLQGEPTRVAENGHTEPEASASGESGSATESKTTNQADTLDDLLASNIELLDAVQTRLWYDKDNDDEFDSSTEKEIFQGTLRKLFKTIQNGIPLDGNFSTDKRDCFPQDEPGSESVRYVGFEWWVPTAVGNEIQGDSVRFDIRFAATQCRNNDGSQNPFDNA